MKDPVFIVTNGSKTYKIWADGQVEGFDISPQIVINRIPQLTDEIEHHNLLLKESTMNIDIDRKLLSRAVALLGEARDVVERVRHKAEDQRVLPARARISPPEIDETLLEMLVTTTNDIDAIIATVDKFAKED